MDEGMEGRVWKKQDFEEARANLEIILDTCQREQPASRTRKGTVLDYSIAISTSFLSTQIFAYFLCVQERMRDSYKNICETHALSKTTVHFLFSEEGRR